MNAPENNSQVPSDVDGIFRYKTIFPLSISAYTTLVFQWVVYTVVCQTIDVFGLVTNIINIVCFVKQGFKDPVNISLL
ncbi:unnamed protein product, partial [Candidula unifasciata]